MFTGLFLAQACRGWAPLYDEAERSRLRDVLWAARQVLTESFGGGLPDARVGGDLLPLLLQGWRGAPESDSRQSHSAATGACDFSGFHTAVLFSGSSLVSVGTLLLFQDYCQLIIIDCTRTVQWMVLKHAGEHFFPVASVAHA